MQSKELLLVYVLTALAVAIPGKDGLYELIAGERRLRAGMAAGLDTVPVTIIHDLSDEQALALALSENLHRDGLNPVEETEGILQLLALRLSLPVKEVPLLKRGDSFANNR